MKKKNDTDNNDDNDVLDITRKFYSLIIITMQKHQDSYTCLYLLDAIIIQSLDIWQTRRCYKRHGDVVTCIVTCLYQWACVSCGQVQM